jgi:hypothetical protein
MKLAQNGTVEPADWEPWSRHTHAWLKNPAVRAWWERQDTPFGDDFKAHIEGLLASDKRPPTS